MYRVCFGICICSCRKPALFAVNRSLRKRSLFLVINMAFADLMLGILLLSIYIYYVGYSFELWKGGWPVSLSIFYDIFEIFFMRH